MNVEYSRKTRKITARFGQIWTTGPGVSSQIQFLVILRPHSENGLFTYGAIDGSLSGPYIITPLGTPTSKTLGDETDRYLTIDQIVSHLNRHYRAPESIGLIRQASQENPHEVSLFV